MIVPRPLQLDGVNVDAPYGASGIKGIALSPDTKHVYWTCANAFALYSAPARLLVEGLDEDIQDAIMEYGNLSGLPGGITVGENGALFTGGGRAMNVFEIMHGRIATVNTIPSEDALTWISSWAWDNKGSLWLLSNKYHRWLYGLQKGKPMDWAGRSGSNVRIMKKHVGTKSYMCAQGGVSC